MTPTRIHELLALRAAQTPDAVFLHETTGNTTYAALQTLVEAATQDLLDAGVWPTDRVLLVAENCPAHIALIMACSRVGAWSCGVNARMSPGEIAAIVERADARLCYFTSAASDAAQQHAQRAQAVPSASGASDSEARKPIDLFAQKLRESLTGKARPAS